MIEWKDDKILRHAFAYKQIAEDGFHIPSGVLHAPGSALTIELQEDSDVFVAMQAKISKTFISKDLLYKDLRIEDKEKFGEIKILEMIQKTMMITKSGRARPFTILKNRFNNSNSFQNPMI